MSVYLRIKRAEAATWATKNPVLREGEPGLATDTGVFKIGDGTTAWLDLPARLDAAALADAIANFRVELLGGAQPAWDTFQELKALADSGDAAAQSAIANLVTVVGGKLAQSQNLADLPNIALARDNLGLGPAATKTMAQIASDAALAATYASRVAPSYAGARTKPFDPITNLYASPLGRAKLRRARGAMLAAKTSLVPMTLGGDSSMSGWGAGTIGVDDRAAVLIALLKAAGYPVTGGWVFPNNGKTPGDPRYTFGGTNSWQGRGGTTNNYIWSQASGNTVTLTVTSITATVVEFGLVTTVAGQSVNYVVDGGASTPYALTANQMNKKTLAVAAGSHSFTITTTGTGIVWFCGGVVRDATGLSITNAGIFGSHARDWRPDAISSSIINPFNLTTALNGQPKFVDLALGGNEAIHGTDGTPAYTPATMKTDLSAIVNGYQSAGSALMLCTYPYLTTANQTLLASKQAAGVTWDTFLSNYYDVADTYDVPLLDLSSVLGDSNTLKAAGLMSADDTHLTSIGQAAVADLEFGVLQAA